MVEGMQPVGEIFLPLRRFVVFDHQDATFLYFQVGEDVVFGRLILDLGLVVLRLHERALFEASEVVLGARRREQAELSHFAF